MGETPLQNKMVAVLNFIDGCKAVVRTVGFFGRVGESDVYGCYKGTCFVIEVKKPGKLPTKIQHKRLREWDASGAKTTWLDSMDGLYKFIKEMDDEKR